MTSFSKVLMIIAFLWNIVLTFTHCHASSMEHHTSSTYPFIKYEGTISSENRELFEEQLGRLVANPKGRELLHAISTHLSGTGQHFLILSGAQHSFSPPKIGDSSPYLLIYINFELIRAHPDTPVGCIGNIVHKVHEVERDFYQIGEMHYPFYFILGHELIHALHFLENEGQYRDYLARFDDSLWNLSPDLQKMGFIWNNLEEQRTVIGEVRGHIMDGFSELTLLLAEGRAPRYAYQSSSSHFYENASIIQKILLHHPASLENLPALIREGWIFHHEAALSSHYNPQEIRIKSADLLSSAPT